MIAGDSTRVDLAGWISAGVQGRRTIVRRTVLRIPHLYVQVIYVDGVFLPVSTGPVGINDTDDDGTTGRSRYDGRLQVAAAGRGNGEQRQEAVAIIQ